MKLLILFFLITSYCYSEEPLDGVKYIPFVGKSLHMQGRQIYFATIKPLLEGQIESKYKPHQIAEIQQEIHQQEIDDVAINKAEIKQGKYWVNGQWIYK